MSNRHLARTIALQTLYQWDFNGQPPDALATMLAGNFHEFAPDFDDDGFSRGLVAGVEKNLAAIADRLEKDPTNYDDWLAVAYIKKLFSNLPGAKDAWEYAKIVNQQNPIAYFNLGELYGYELKEPAKAEENYKSALRLNPYHFDYYIGLANFYEDVPKDLKKAEETLLSALDKIPHTEPNLFAQIGAFYRDQKDYSKALEFFGKALGATTDPGVKKAIQNEIDYIHSKQ